MDNNLLRVDLKLKELIKREVHQIWLTVHRDGSDEPHKSDVMFTTSEKGVDFLFNLFQLLKTMTRSFLPTSNFNKDEEFETILAILFQEFISVDHHLVKDGSVKDDIVEYIDRLKIRPPKIIKSFQKGVNSLIQEQIDFWELVQRRYLEQSEEIDKRLQLKLNERFNLT